MQPLDDKGEIRTNEVRFCKSTCRIAMDVGIGIADSAVDFNWTLDR